MENLNEQISQWLETPEDSRNIEQGALLLLKIDRNRIAYDNILRNPSKYASHLEYQLRKHLNFRLAEITHDHVLKLQKEAEKVYHKNFGFSEQEIVDAKRGLRADHDKLPAEIKQAYISAMEKRRRIAQCHLKAREIMDSNVKCKDSELYPWVKEIVALDKEVHKLFKQYDSYTA